MWSGFIASDIIKNKYDNNKFLLFWEPSLQQMSHLSNLTIINFYGEFCNDLKLLSKFIGIL